MFEEETFENILDRVLERVPDDIDTRESSFVYTAAASVCLELEEMYADLGMIYDAAFYDTADREGKLKKCEERGIDITQFDATAAEVILETAPAELEVDIGSRFGMDDDLIYTVTEKISDGVYLAVAETEGSAGNVTGDVTPVDYMEGLETAQITSVREWGKEEEDESQIDDVFYGSLNAQAFGGNREYYYEEMKKISGVGGVKIYSAGEWNGGGTVRLVFTTSEDMKPEPSFVEEVQQMIDPHGNKDGEGIAPVGHTVTVEGVSETSVDVQMHLELQAGYEWEDVREYAEQSVDKYLQSLNEGWEDVNGIIVRISQLEIRMLELPGVVDVRALSINGKEENLVLDKDAVAVRGNMDAEL